MSQNLIIHYGEVTSRRRILARGACFVALALAWVMVFLVLPSLMMAAMGFAHRGEYGEVIWSFTGANFKRLIGFGIMGGWSSVYLTILLRSLWVAFVTTTLCILISYPMAFFIAGRSPRARYLWLALIVIPGCTNLVIRTCAWMLILGHDMPPAKLLQFLGLLDADSALFPSPIAVYIGMLSCFLPFTVLPLYTSVERMDWAIVEAARDLYASKWRTFIHAILPQTAPGLMSAIILTFIPAMGVFVVPDMLGGAKYMLTGNLIQQQFSASNDWPFGSAVCFGLMAITLAGLFAIRRFGKHAEVNVS